MTMIAWAELVDGGVLALMALAPGALVWLLPSGRRRAEAGSAAARVGSTRTTGRVPAREPGGAIARPLVHMARTMTERELRRLVLGLRLLPIEQAAALLSSQLRCRDPELRIYAQTVRQEGLERLQTSYLKFRALAGRGSPGNTASFLGVGLRLLDTPFVPESDRDSILADLLLHAERAYMENQMHPRLVFEAGRVYLRRRQLEDARAMFARLPTGSPLEEKARTMLDHHECIARAATGRASPP